MELGDRRLSDLLRQMKSLAGSSISDELIKSLWLQRLPQQTQAILSIIKDSLNNIAEMADKIIAVYSSSEHVPGKDNIIADALSRIDELHLQPTIDYEGIAKAQEMDEELKEILSSHNSSLKLEKVPIFGSNFDIFCDCSAKKRRPYIPEAFRRIVFNNIHNLAHPGIRTITKFKRKPFKFKDLKDCSHVFVHTDSVRRSLQPPYHGPYKVINRSDKVFTLFIKGKNVNVSIDRLKPCFSDNSSETDIESSIGEDTPNKPAKMPEKKIRFAHCPFLLQPE
ncbi:uncharacterized protein TNIN_107321 [Trichonephila inaurata madagascariensis]|uniref:Uncharacterized protein n=1 Tax=Trichonephila inaurata madagascariensis TaxID=2747483 RepID=A0A8X6XY05_9ARAC|nr:uncharacterized protein TNIN_107321 [Trichonephila inaurata madagascariensis]